MVLPTSFTVAPLQLSEAVGLVNDGVAAQSIVEAAVAAPMVGAVLSMAVMVCVTVPECLPQASVASHDLV